VPENLIKRTTHEGYSAAEAENYDLVILVSHGHGKLEAGFSLNDPAFSFLLCQIRLFSDYLE